MYEIPERLRSLYRHWPDHISPEIPIHPISLNTEVLSDMERFMAERMHMWHKRTEEETPLTSDPTLSQFRFCNIYRELDRQTIEIHELLRGFRDDFPLWLLNAAFCRFVCNIQTIRAVGLLNFDAANNTRVYKNLLQLPKPKYGTAYVFPISAIQKSKYPTREEFFCLYLPSVINTIAEYLKEQRKASISDILPKVTKLFGFNLKFHWTEILIDIAYQYPQLIDLYSRFPIGPGSTPTMHLLNPKADPEEVAIALIQHQPQNFPYLSYKDQPVLLSAENWEGVGCEFRKYTNLTNGVGRKRRYRTSTTLN